MNSGPTAANRGRAEPRRRIRPLPGAVLPPRRRLGCPARCRTRPRCTRPHVNPSASGLQDHPVAPLVRISVTPLPPPNPYPASRCPADIRGSRGPRPLPRTVPSGRGDRVVKQDRSHRDFLYANCSHPASPVGSRKLKGPRWELKGPSSCSAELLPWARGQLATLPFLVPWTGKTPSGPLLERSEAELRAWGRSRELGGGAASGRCCTGGAGRGRRHGAGGARRRAVDRPRAHVRAGAGPRRRARRHVPVSLSRSGA